MSQIAVTANVNITQQDIVTVAVSRAETLMQSKFTEAAGRITALEKTIKITKKEIEDTLNTVGRAAVLGACEKTVAGLSFFGKASYRVTQVNQQDDKTNVHVEFRTRDGNYGNYGTFSPDPFVINTPPKVVVLRATVNETEAQLATAREEAVMWRKKLASISTLERKYRAQLVETEMNKTVEGAAMLANIGAKFEQDVLALPG